MKQEKLVGISTLRPALCLPEKKMVPRPKRITAPRMHLFTEKPLSSSRCGNRNSSSFSSSSSVLPIRSRAAKRDLLLLSSGSPSSAVFRGLGSPTAGSKAVGGKGKEKRWEFVVKDHFTFDWIHHHTNVGQKVQTAAHLAWRYSQIISFCCVYWFAHH